MSVCVFSIFRHLVCVQVLFVTIELQLPTMLSARLAQMQKETADAYIRVTASIQVFCPLHCTFQLFKSFADRPCLKLDRLPRKKNIRVTASVRLLCSLSFFFPFLTFLLLMFWFCVCFPIFVSWVTLTKNYIFRRVLIHGTYFSFSYRLPLSSR